MHRVADRICDYLEGIEGYPVLPPVRPGEVAAALLGSDERLEYTLLGDTVNLAQRLEGLARPAGTTVLSEATALALSARPDLEPLPTQTVKGRATPVTAFRFGPSEGTAP